MWVAVIQKVIYRPGIHYNFEGKCFRVDKLGTLIERHQPLALQPIHSGRVSDILDLKKKSTKQNWKWLQSTLHGFHVYTVFTLFNIISNKISSNRECEYNTYLKLIYVITRAYYLADLASRAGVRRALKRVVCRWVPRLFALPSTYRQYNYRTINYRYIIYRVSRNGHRLYSYPPMYFIKRGTHLNTIQDNNRLSYYSN